MSGQPKSFNVGWSVRDALGDGVADAAAVGSRFMAGGVELAKFGTTIPAGGSVELVELPASGVIERLEIRDNRAELSPEDTAAIELEIAASPALEANEGGMRPRAVDIAVRLDDLFGPAAREGEGNSWQTPGLAMDRGVQQISLPIPFAPGARITLRNRGRSACRVAARASGVACTLPSDIPYLRAQTARVAAHAPPGEIVLFEAHGRGQFAGVVCPAAIAPEVLDTLRLTFYRDGDERLQQIEEFNLRDYIAAATVAGTSPTPPAANANAQPRLHRFHAIDPMPFAEYIKCSLTWRAPPPVQLTFTTFVYIEDRPIA